ncbi:sugar ABC transporter permease [Thermicanus aegyptius]|uniref:sugar ABC transporter permease n=1 Tax=Thermicanus aegyptius TaxID=94009 RepID=UPI0003F899AD|nr:sugar ABC transporter permease [Thermicanus aegyptius]
METKKTFHFDIRAYSMFVALILIAIIFSIYTDGAFLSSRNLSNLFRQMSVTSILAIGMTLVIVAGHIDLSVGSIVGLTGGIAAILQVWYGWDTVWVILAALVVGLLLGLWQGWWVAYLGVPSFIVTLGGMMVFRGILIGVSKGETIAPLHEDFIQIGQSYLPYAWGYLLLILFIVVLFLNTYHRRKKRKKYGLSLNQGYIDYGKTIFYSLLATLFVYMMNRYLGIPTPIMIVLLLAILFTFIANRTGFGRHLYAIGGNPEAARYSGINIRRHLLLIFTIMGLLAGIAGVVLTGRLNAATVGAGQMYELDAIAAAVIGGSSLMGGVGTIVGSITGALVMVSLDNGMSMMNIQPFWQYIVKGLILILAVFLDILSKKKIE